MMDKIPIKTLLDHAKQPFIPYTTAKSVMWDGTDKTLYDVVMEGVPVPEASTEAMPTFLIKDNSSVNPLVLCDCKPGIYLKPSPTSGAITWWLAGESGATAKQIYTSNQGIFVTEQPTPETINSTVFYQNNNLINCVLNYSSSKRLTESTLNRPEYLMNSSGTSTLLYSQVMFNKIPTFASNLTPAKTVDVVNKGYVDGAITEALASYTPTVDLSNYYTKEEIDTELGERDTALNADIMVAINAAGRAEMEVQNKQNKITYGTGDPSGGSNGDVYLKYTA